jgi:hypothetical protein
MVLNRIKAKGKIADLEATSAFYCDGCLKHWLLETMSLLKTIITENFVALRLCVPFFCRLYAMSFNILSSSSLYCHNMFWPNQRSSGVQVVVMKDSAAH